MSSKRKHKTLALKDKMDILMKLDSGESMCKLAKEYGVGRATIHDLKKKKQKIVDHVLTMESGPGKRKTLKFGNCPEMENALYMWFMEESSKQIPVSGEILKAKAIEFYKKITKKDDFRASNGWLDKFKKRFGINLLIQSSSKMLWPTMNAVSQETEEWDPKDNIPTTDRLQNLSKRGLRTSHEDLNPWFEGTEETEEIMTDEEMYELAQGEENFPEILEPPTTTAVKVKPDTAFNCFNTCITWAEENGVSTKDIIILRNLREKVFKQGLQVEQKQTSIKDYFKTITTPAIKLEHKHSL